MKRASLFTALIALALPATQASTLLDTAFAADGTPKLHLAKKDASAKKATPKTPSTKFGAPADKAKADAKDAPAEDKAAPADNTAEQAAPSNTLVATCRDLRKQMDEAKEAMKTISKPSRALVNRCNSTEKYVNTQLEKLEATATEAAALQAKSQGTMSKEYQFTIVTQDQRDKYVQDGTAAYKAMVVDVQQKKSKRKIAGLDKFEILRERYQGIPEYKEANTWYEKTLKDLEGKWSKMQAAEEKKREKLQATKRQKMEEDDEKSFEKLEKLLKADGDDIAKTWYVPETRNLRMLSHCLNKVRDAQRRYQNSNERAAEYYGVVPGLLTKFWEGMDAAREKLIAGDLDGASELLDNNDETFNRIVRLPRNVMPDEYKEPLKEQRQHIMKEIKDRGREKSSTDRDLERKLSTFERDSENISARIQSLLEDIEREQATDVGENTVKVGDKTADDAADAAPEAEGDDAAAKDGKKDAKKDDAKAKEDKPKTDGKAKGGDAKAKDSGSKGKNTGKNKGKSGK